MDIDWIMQGTLEKEISQKKAIMEEKAVAIKWVKMGFQKVFRELAMEMIMSKVEIIEGLTNRAARKTESVSGGGLQPHQIWT